MHTTRTASCTLLVLASLIPAASADAPSPAPLEASKNEPKAILSDGKLRLTYGEERVILLRGLQPSLLCTRSGTLILQAQVPEKPFPSKRMAYPYAMCTRISRDGGLNWSTIPLKPGDNGLNMEGGITQFRDGTIVSLDTYVIPAEKDGTGVGQLYVSTDDWKTVRGPLEVSFDMPNAKFTGSSDDGGRPHAAQRAHRRILELPNGDLLTTLYGWLQGDATPSTYAKTMIKTRCFLFRSADRGNTWKLVSTIAVDPAVGTEGFGEPVLCRVSQGIKAGRLICFMRTGRNMYQATSDDGGASWSPPREQVFAGLDINRTDLWVEHFRNFKDFRGKLLDENNPDELRGAVVDPDLIELRSGLLVAAFGVRVPQKLCWRYPEYPWNGNYLAFSRDHGQTWSNVVRITSGVLTTHYMAIEETPKDGTLYITYDLGGWSKGLRRDVIGRTVKIEQ